MQGVSRRPLIQAAGSGRRIRLVVASPLLLSAGSDVNIEAGAQFGGRHVSLGDRSGLGVNCRVSGELHVGRDVMMGRDVVIHAKNHAFDDLQRPMIDQGQQPPAPVTIGDDVWIGDRVLIVPGVTVGTVRSLGSARLSQEMCQLMQSLRETPPESSDTAAKPEDDDCRDDTWEMLARLPARKMNLDNPSIMFSLDSMFVGTLKTCPHPRTGSGLACGSLNNIVCPR